MASARIEHNSTGIHQILASASPGDAITNVALALRRTLRAAGPSEIFAYHVSRELSGEVLRIADYRVPHSRNLLILHASIGQPEVHEFVVSRREPVVLVYHNVTPARFFEPYDLAFAALLTLGRRTLEQRQDRTYLCLQLAGTLGRTSGPRRSARGACGPEVGQEIPQLRHGKTQAPQVLNE